MNTGKKIRKNQESGKNAGNNGRIKYKKKVGI